MRKKNLRGLYVLSDDILTPYETIFEQAKSALQSGATIFQLRDKSNDTKQIKKNAIELQLLCQAQDALFVLNDYVELAIELSCDGLHVGKSDYHRLEQIRQDFRGILGVSCYGDIEFAKKMQKMGMDYVAFGSFFPSPTKPHSNVVPLEIIQRAKQELSIPICVIGGINTSNLGEIMKYSPDMVCSVSDIWQADDIERRVKIYTKEFS